MSQKLTDIDPDDDLYSIESFQDSVKLGCFIDYDGFGLLATKNKVSDIEIYPSQALSFQYPSWATHVVWFNK
jgi:hypothetical protein